MIGFMLPFMASASEIVGHAPPAVNGAASTDLEADRARAACVNSADRSNSPAKMKKEGDCQEWYELAKRLDQQRAYHACLGKKPLFENCREKQARELTAFRKQSQLDCGGYDAYLANSKTYNKCAFAKTDEYRKRIVTTARRLEQWSDVSRDYRNASAAKTVKEVCQVAGTPPPDLKKILQASVVAPGDVLSLHELATNGRFMEFHTAISNNLAEIQKICKNPSTADKQALQILTTNTAAELGALSAVASGHVPRDE